MINIGKKTEKTWRPGDFLILAMKPDRRLAGIELLDSACLSWRVVNCLGLIHLLYIYIYTYRDTYTLYYIILYYVFMGVSLKLGYPKSSKIRPFEYWNPWFWGTPILGNLHIYTWNPNDLSFGWLSLHFADQNFKTRFIWVSGMCNNHTSRMILQRKNPVALSTDLSFFQIPLRNANI
jgi:hypothetical protein